jgi:hypothetical protein
MRDANDSNKKDIEKYLEEIIKNESYDELVNVFEIGRDPKNPDFEKTILDALKKKGYLFHLFKYSGDNFEHFHVNLPKFT